MSFDFDNMEMLDRTRVAGLIEALDPRVQDRWRRLSESAPEIISQALSVDPDAPAGGIDQIEHVVILMNENRSFDHYFGTLSGVRGYDDPSAALLSQAGYRDDPRPGAPGFLNPFRIDVKRIIHSPSHSWEAQHSSWNGGHMDAWLRTHLRTDHAAYAPLTMGYYARADLPIHFALADAFTVCDNYFCSVLGPTDPNRLMAMTGTLDPDGWAGGPSLETPLVRDRTFSWRSYPECLQQAGVSWKIYQDRTFGQLSETILGGMMDWFAAYGDGGDAELRERAFHQDYPGTFRSDVASGQLPAVSWIVPSALECEHPTFPPSLGAVGILGVLNELLSNADLWAHTVLIVTYDENGGFFDHVSPPTPPADAEGEWISQALARERGGDGVAGPVGLGFRVPCLLISPFSRGGCVATERFDHTSVLRFLEAVFGVPVPRRDPAARRPGISAWRESMVGDLTSAFNFSTAAIQPIPQLPPRPRDNPWSELSSYAGFIRAFLDLLPKYPVPQNELPHQETVPTRSQLPHRVPK